MTKDYQAFLNDLGHRESNNNYACKNAFGFLGRWQFGKPRLYDMGYSLGGWHPKNRSMKRIISEKYFLDNIDNIQDRVMNKHITNLSDSISRNHKDSLDTMVSGIGITLSGLVAGAHLKGLGGVRKFLKGKDNADALGTKISEYIFKFAGYNLKGFTVKDEIASLDKLAVPRPVEIIPKQRA